MPNLQEQLLKVRRDTIKQVFGSHKNLFDLDRLVENYEGLFFDNALVNTIGSNKPNIMIQYASMMAKCKTPEARKELFIDTIAKLVSGKMKFDGAPDPYEVSGDRLKDRIEVQAEFLLNLGMNIQGHSNKKLGYAPVFDNFGIGIKTDEDVVKQYAEIERKVKSYKNDPVVITNKANKVMEAYDKLAKNDNEELSQEDFDAIKVEHTLPMLIEIANAHYNREKPGFFARLFRTEKAREYAAERVALNSLVDKLKQVDTKNDLNLDMFKTKASFNANADTIEEIKKEAEGKIPYFPTVEKRVKEAIYKAGFAYDLEDKSFKEKFKEETKALDEEIKNENERQAEPIVVEEAINKALEKDDNILNNEEEVEYTELDEYEEMENKIDI